MARRLLAIAALLGTTLALAAIVRREDAPASRPPIARADAITPTPTSTPRRGVPRVVAGRLEVDRAKAQELVDRFVRAGAKKIFVGAGLRLRGPTNVVQPWPNHDDHLHLRL
jgi:hypothetical protein